MPVRDLLSAASGTGGATDPYFYDVSLLLNGDGTNGAQNNTFLDSSTNNFTITRNGNTTQGSFSPYGNLWSNYLSGTSSYLTTGTSVSLSGSFTYEVWVNINTSNLSVIGCIGDEFLSSGMTFFVNSSGNIRIYTNNGYINNITGTTIPNNTWTHIAFVRNSGTLTTYVNGVSVNTVSHSATLSGVVYVGNERYNGTNSPSYYGYASNVRLTNTAVYTTTFTPSTTPLTAISGTQLLTCQSNRFIDNSTNNATVTPTGTPSVQRFSPFNPTAPYSTSVIGGSGYFDGSSYLTTPSSSQPVASGDFTISAWFYLTSFSNSYYVVGGNWTSGNSGEWLIQIQNNGAIRFLTTGSSSFSSSGLVSLNQWYYFSATRSGTTVTASLNGTSFASYSLSGSLGLSSESIYIGEQAGNNWPFAGYISDFRFVTSNLGSTVPKSPATAVSGTQLLTNFTNAGIPDLAMMNDLQTVGNAQVSTSVKKYGTGSISFDGSTAYLLSPATGALGFGTGDFTIENWIYFPSTPGNGQFLRSGGSGNTNGIAWQFYSGNLQLYSQNNALEIQAAWSPSATTWYHVALTRSGTTLRIFVNGTQIGSNATSSTSFVDGAIYVAYGGAGYLNGYLDDLRITKGYARYTSNFTPPTSALPTY